MGTWRVGVYPYHGAPGRSRAISSARSSCLRASGESWPRRRLRRLVARARTCSPNATESTSRPPSGTTASPLHEVRKDHTATLLLDGRLLVAGGSQDFTAADGSLASRTLASVEIFDPETGSWAMAAPMLHARALHSATLLRDGRVVVLGGAAVTTFPVADAVVTNEIFDPSSGKWTLIAAPPKPIHGGFTVASLADGRLLLLSNDQKERMLS